jgi:protease I
MKVQIFALFALTLIICFSACTQKAEAHFEEKTVEGGKMVEEKKVLFVVAQENFRDEELFEPKEILEGEGAKVVIASKSKGVAKGMLGAEIEVDESIYDLSPENFDAVIFVGGTGAANYFNDEKVLEFARKAYEQGKVIGAICIAPVILANAGILEGKKPTVWPSEADTKKEKGAIYTGEDVEVDGKIITASGPRAAREFGMKIAELLKG